MKEWENPELRTLSAEYTEFGGNGVNPYAIAFKPSASGGSYKGNDNGNHKDNGNHNGKGKHDGKG